MVLALVVLVGGLVFVRFRLTGDGHGSPVGAPSGRRVSSQGAAPDVLTASSASPSARARAGVAASSAAAPPFLEPTGAVVSPSPAPSAGSRVGGRVGGRAQATGVPVAPRPSGPVLGLSATTVDLGAVDSTWRLDLRGEGTAAVDVVVGTTPAWLAVVPKERRVDPGANVPLMITLNRSTAPVGPVDVTVPVAAENGVGGADVRITASVDGSPRITAVTNAPDSVVRSGCGPSPSPGADPARSTVTVTAEDGTGIFAVELAATLPGGQSQDLAMSLGPQSGDRSTWTAALTASQDTGTITYSVTVTDLNGRHSQASGSLAVLPCPTN
ncbi:hypothetical protein [Frankia sp. AgB32]|uniref:hypothetical protein n=1 Tax=Frankia sp. AgB32 TaxID=631119 RepID=UPI00200BA6B3|nr:hypothetical protein [Frankia sp. AgB32]MCK9894078.1 hypothetical protein [Frankia sp. AgB32]